jgi:hypothetical protein
MEETAPDSNEKEQDKRRLGHAIALGAIGAITAGIFIYMVLIVAGQIPQQNRLGLGEVGLALVAGLFLTLLTYPEAFERLSLLKLPGGIELTLAQIQRQQVEQQQELNTFFAILTNLLSMPEKYHLRALARGGEKYTGRPPLRDELFRLMRYGLIDEVKGQNIGDIHDGKEIELADFVKLTPNGEKFVRALPELEAH